MALILTIIYKLEHISSMVVHNLEYLSQGLITTSKMGGKSYLQFGITIFIYIYKCEIEYVNCCVCNCNPWKILKILFCNELYELVDFANYVIS